MASVDPEDFKRRDVSPLLLARFYRAMEETPGDSESPVAPTIPFRARD